MSRLMYFVALAFVSMFTVSVLGRFLAKNSIHKADHSSRCDWETVDLEGTWHVLPPVYMNIAHWETKNRYRNVADVLLVTAPFSPSAPLDPCVGMFHVHGHIYTRQVSPFPPTLAVVIDGGGKFKKIAIGGDDGVMHSGTGEGHHTFGTLSLNGTVHIRFVAFNETRRFELDKVVSKWDGVTKLNPPAKWWNALSRALKSGIGNEADNFAKFKVPDFGAPF